MELRPYFLIGDIVANCAVGALAGFVVAWMTLSGWPMPLGMLVGMIVGMFIGLIASLVVFTPLFGAMEVMVPCMLVCMLIGMIAGMWPIAPGIAALWGAGIGLCVVLFVGVMNALMRGPQKLPEN